MEFKDLNRADLLAALGSRGRDIHVQRMMTSVYRQGLHDPTAWGNQKELTASSRELFTHAQLEAHEIARSQDGSAKLKIKVAEKYIESVYLPIRFRSTVCVSSQVGCTLDCKFCLTAQLDFMRNLKPWEIVDQVLLMKRTFGKDATNIVFMGMGEPFYNFENVKKAVEILSDPWGLGLGKTKITVSTSGHAPGIEKWGQEVNTSLAVSLITADMDLRSSLMSINKKYGIPDLVEAMKSYIAHTNRKVFVEYILMKDLTDSQSAAVQLAALLKDMKVTINLIPYNENPHLDFKRPSLEHIYAFREELRSRGIFATIRWSYGGDVSAACGQLSAA